MEISKFCNTQSKCLLINETLSLKFILEMESEMSHFPQLKFCSIKTVSNSMSDFTDKSCSLRKVIIAGDHR